MLPDGKKLGGAPANFAYHCHALGAKAYPVSCVGKDALGAEIKDKISSIHLSNTYIATDSTHPTGTVDIKLDSNGKPAYLIHENVAWDYIPWSENLAALAQKTDGICFGTLAQRSPVSKNTICKFLDLTSPKCLRLFDVNFRQSFFNPEICKALLKRSSAVKLNDEEVSVLATMLKVNGTCAQVAKALLASYNLKFVIITRGNNGSLLITRDSLFAHPGFDAQLVDTVGAGDAFSASVMVGFLSNLDFQKINELANRLASFVCGKAGATPEVPEYLGQQGQTYK